MLIWIIVGILAVLLLLPSLRRREGMDSFADFKVRFIVMVSTTYLQISQLEVMYQGQNIAKGKRVGTRSEIMPGMAELAVDGTSRERAFPDIYQSGQEGAGWVLDLGAEYPIEEITYYNRADGCGNRALDMRMFLYNANFDQVGPEITFTDEAKQTFTFSAESESETTMSSSSGSGSGSSTGAGAGSSSGASAGSSSGASAGSSTGTGSGGSNASNSPSLCGYKQTSQTCRGSVDQNGASCIWSDATRLCSPQSINQSSISNSQNCSVKTTKNSCESTLINAEDRLYCSWSPAQNKCSYTSAGTGGGPTYSASAGVNLPTNVSNNCALCTGAGYYWNPTSKACTVTDTPGYQRSC